MTITFTSLKPSFFFVTTDLDHRLEVLNGPDASSKPKRRSVRFSEATDMPRPKVSFTILKYILRHPSNKPKVLKKNLDQVQMLKNMMEV